MSRVRVKICGITRPDDALAAVEAGADAVGLVFYPPSSRNLDLEKARRIVDVLPAYVTPVAVVVDPDPDALKQIIEETGVRSVQFHGKESPSFCANCEIPWIKAIRVRDTLDLADIQNQYAGAQAILLDTYVPDIVGGTGHAFDWRRAREVTAKPVVLAGGLTPDTVADAIRSARPYAVDVSTGVEAAPGQKDHRKIRLFIESVLSASIAHNPDIARHAERKVSA